MTVKLTRKDKEKLRKALKEHLSVNYAIKVAEKCELDVTTIRDWFASDKVRPNIEEAAFTLLDELNTQRAERIQKLKEATN